MSSIIYEMFHNSPRKHSYPGYPTPVSPRRGKRRLRKRPFSFDHNIVSLHNSAAASAIRGAMHSTSCGTRARAGRIRGHLCAWPVNGFPAAGLQNQQQGLRELRKGGDYDEVLK